MAKVPNMSGQEATLGFFVGPTKREILAKTWSVTRAGTKISDGVNGEDRNRFDFITDGFDISVEVFMPDVKMISTFIEDQTNDDSGVAPLDKALSVKLKPRDGSKGAFVFSEVTLDDWKIASSGRPDRLMTTVPMRARYMKAAPV